MDEWLKPDFAAQRAAMVSGQLKPWKVTDERVLEAMGAVPRELFVPKALKGLAYVDEDLEVAPGRYIMEPRVLARLIQEAEVAPGDVVLEIGTVTGYGAAVLARLANTVVALECDEALAETARAALDEAGADNVAVVTGPLEKGWPQEGPFNVIFVNGAVEEIPDAWIDQLAEGGRLVCVKRSGDESHGYLVVKSGNASGGRPAFDAFTPLLPGFARPPAFQF